MQFNVEYKDAAGRIHKRTETVTCLQFLKSFAVAGQGSLPSPKTFNRIVGAFLFYEDYLGWGSIRHGRFSEPPAERRDPTERNQFSNQVGKAIADLLARRIHNAKATYNYESAMATWDPPLKIKGKRPDFLCDTGSRIIAIEAKGYAVKYVSPAKMAEVKTQSQQGLLPKDASVASVAYGLYSQLCVKYHDPDNERPARDEKFCRRLAKGFYKDVLGFLNDPRFVVSQIVIQDRRLLRITLNPEIRPWFIIKSNAIHLLGFKSVALLLASELIRVAEDGDISAIPPQLEASGVWVDGDGIGIELREFPDPEEPRAPYSGGTLQEDEQP